MTLATQKEKAAARHKAYREANRKKIAAYKKAYREANRKKIAAYNKMYYRNNTRKIGNRISLNRVRINMVRQDRRNIKRQEQLEKDGKWTPTPYSSIDFTNN